MARNLRQRKEGQWKRKFSVSLSNTKELCAMILWVLHTEFNFGKKRLYKFYKAFSTEIDALAKRYLMDDCKPDKRPWLCIQKLERDGIFIDEWERTVNNGNSEV